MLSIFLWLGLAVIITTVMVVITVRAARRMNHGTARQRNEYGCAFGCGLTYLVIVAFIAIAAVVLTVVDG